MYSSIHHHLLYLLLSFDLSIYLQYLEMDDKIKFKTFSWSASHHEQWIQIQDVLQSSSIFSYFKCVSKVFSFLYLLTSLMWQSWIVEKKKQLPLSESEWKFSLFAYVVRSLSIKWVQVTPTQSWRNKLEILVLNS